MLTKLLVGGITAAAVGVGGASYASSNAPSTDQPAQYRHGARLLRLAKHLVHGQVVTRNAQGQFVTHDLIHGTVAQVDAASIRVVAADSTAETFTITKDTRVRIRRDGTGSRTTIGSVHPGDEVLVAGVGTGTPTARIVVDVKQG